jgi:hypothetical protein
LCYTKPGDNLSNWKIALPKELITPTVKWYHQVTGHPGSKRLYEQIRQRFTIVTQEDILITSSVAVANGTN